MKSAEKIAKFFVFLANENEDDPITNLKLNKLLYYAQGIHLARTGEPLFDEDIEAWRYGPVVPSVYRTYKVCGNNPIQFQDEKINTDEFDEEELETLLDTAREFGQYTGAKLVSMTHKPDTPWSEAYNSRSSVISRDIIEEYFRKHPVVEFQASDEIEQVVALPADWYDPSEDEEWEAYL